ncbi:MAG: transcriptional regulator [Clostridia bacterium]|nr:transcriptional regulator [Clostridia bacterium]
MKPSNEKEKQKIIISLKKANTLSAKLIEMLEDGEYCIDIMQQNLAAIGLLRSAHHMLFEKHLNSCFKNAMASGSIKIQTRMIEEILKVTKLANK